MLSDALSIVSWRSRPRSFVALMSLYESNYLRLAQLAGNLAALADMKATKADIANAFHVPLPFLTGETNLANMQASDHLHKTLAILPDQLEYLQIADNLRHQHDVSFLDHRFGARVEAYRMPGYPAFVALWRGNVTAIRVAQAFIDTSTVLAAYLLARRWLSAASAW